MVSSKINPCFCGNLSLGTLTRYGALTCLIITIAKFILYTAIEAIRNQPYPFDILNKLLIVADFFIICSSAGLFLLTIRNEIDTLFVKLICLSWLVSAIIGVIIYFLQFVALCDLLTRLVKLTNSNGRKHAFINTMVAIFYAILIIAFIYFIWVVATYLLVHQRKTSVIQPSLAKALKNLEDPDIPTDDKEYDANDEDVSNESVTDSLNKNENTKESSKMSKINKSNKMEEKSSSSSSSTSNNSSNINANKPDAKK